MHMAYAGLDVDLVASFHGSLPIATESQLPGIKARILVAHGNADPFVPLDRVLAFRDALAKSSADWTMMEFGGVKHSFTNPAAENYGIEALVYDPRADQQSWQMLLWLLDDTFK
jgi:dienelactone hydrolase